MKRLQKTTLIQITFFENKILIKRNAKKKLNISLVGIDKKKANIKIENQVIALRNVKL
jgi:hypothetical protein